MERNVVGPTDELQAAFRMLACKHGPLSVVTANSRNLTLTVEDSSKNVYVIDEQCHEPEVFEFNKAYVTLARGSNEDIANFLFEHTIDISIHDHGRICVKYSEQMKMFLDKDDTSFEQMFISHMTRVINDEVLAEAPADDAAKAV